MVMIMAAAVAVLIVIVVVMLVLVATAVAVLIVIVVMLVVVMMSVAMLVHKSLHIILKCTTVFHCKKDLLAVDIRPGSCNNNSFAVMLAYKLYRILASVSFCNVGMREYNGSSIFNLITEKFSEILEVHFALACIHDRNGCIKLCILGLDTLYGLDNVGKLTYSGGLDNNSVGSIFYEHL